MIIHLLFWVAYASADLGPSLRSISVGAMSACGGSIAAFLLWLFWLKKGKSVRISEHFLELRDAGWLTARFPWVDVSSVSTSSTGQLPFNWRVGAWLVGWPRNSIVELHLKRTWRRNLWVATTRGIGLPLFSKRYYFPAPRPDELVARLQQNVDLRS